MNKIQKGSAPPALLRKMNGSSAVYRPLNPKATGRYRCVEDYFEKFVRASDDRFATKFGFRRPHIEKVIHGKRKKRVLVKVIGE